MGIGIEYRDSSKDDGNDEQPPKTLKNIDEKSPSGIGMLPHWLFTNSTLGSNGNLYRIVCQGCPCHHPDGYRLRQDTLYQPPPLVPFQILLIGLSVIPSFLAQSTSEGHDW